jgi:hypothetical protein
MSDVCRNLTRRQFKDMHYSCLPKCGYNSVLAALIRIAQTHLHNLRHPARLTKYGRK